MTPPARPAATLPHSPQKRMGEGWGGGLSRRAAFWFLSLPPILWLGLFFIVPLLLMAAFSFRADINSSFLSGWTLDQYARVAAAGSYWRLLGFSALMAFVVAVGASALAFPIAYFLAFRAGKQAGLYLFLLLIPFWTSYLLRVMALKFMLGSNGVINSLLLYLGLITKPSVLFLYNRTAVVLTLIYVWVPFATLPILAALQRIEVALFEAAADLGANPLAQFWRVTVPLSLPGLFGAFFMVFIPTVGEYVTPLLVGGSSGSMYGNIVQDFFTKAANWSLGSALSMVMLISTLVLAALAVRLVDLRKLLE